MRDRISFRAESLGTYAEAVVTVSYQVQRSWSIAKLQFISIQLSSTNLKIFANMSFAIAHSSIRPPRVAALSRPVCRSTSRPAVRRNLVVYAGVSQTRYLTTYAETASSCVSCQDSHVRIFDHYATPLLEECEIPHHLTIASSGYVHVQYLHLYAYARYISLASANQKGSLTGTIGSQLSVWRRTPKKRLIRPETRPRTLPETPRDQQRT